MLSPSTGLGQVLAHSQLLFPPSDLTPVAGTQVLGSLTQHLRSPIIRAPLWGEAALFV